MLLAIFHLRCQKHMAEKSQEIPHDLLVHRKDGEPTFTYGPNMLFVRWQFYGVANIVFSTPLDDQVSLVLSFILIPTVEQTVLVENILEPPKPSASLHGIANFTAQRGPHLGNKLNGELPRSRVSGIAT